MYKNKNKSEYNCEREERRIASKARTWRKETHTEIRDMTRKDLKEKLTEGEVTKRTRKENSRKTEEKHEIEESLPKHTETQKGKGSNNITSSPSFHPSFPSPVDDLKVFLLFCFPFFVLSPYVITQSQEPEAERNQCRWRIRWGGNVSKNESFACPAGFTLSRRLTDKNSAVFVEFLKRRKDATCERRLRCREKLLENLQRSRTGAHMNNSESVIRARFSVSTCTREKETRTSSFLSTLWRWKGKREEMAFENMEQNG